MRQMLGGSTLVLGAMVLLTGCAVEPQPVIIVQQASPLVRSCNTAFRVFNASGRTVEQLYFSHSSLSGWGPDQLGQNVLPPGATGSYRAANVGNYDFRVVWSGGGSAELRQVNVCAASQITVTRQGLQAS